MLKIESEDIMLESIADRTQREAAIAGAEATVAHAVPASSSKAQVACNTTGQG